jgi:hypothetical protein
MAIMEDRDHFWNCLAASRQKWRQQCYSTMLKTLQRNNTALPLQELLLEALKALLDNRPLHTIRVPSSMTEVAASQQAICWYHILKGCFSKQWKAVQDRHLGPKATKGKNRSTWMTNVIQTWFTEWLKRWTIRNEDRHGRDQPTKTQAENRQAMRELQQFYANHDGRVHDRLQWLFEESITHKLEWRTGSIIMWLNTWKPIVEESYKTALETG